MILPALTFSSQLLLKLLGTWKHMAVELVQEIGRWITLVVNKDIRETVFLFQCLSIALQRGNAVSFVSTFASSD